MGYMSSFLEERSSFSDSPFPRFSPITDLYLGKSENGLSTLEAKLELVIGVKQSWYDYRTRKNLMQETTGLPLDITHSDFFIARGVAQPRVCVESGLNPCVVGARNVGSLARVELGRGWMSPKGRLVILSQAGGPSHLLFFISASGVFS